MVNKLDLFVGGSVGALAAVLAMSYLKSEAVYNRAPLPPVEVQNIDGQGHRGLVVDSINRAHRDIFVNTNQTGGVFLPYRQVATDLMNSYNARVEESVKQALGSPKVEEARKEAPIIHLMSHPAPHIR